ncbi:MAG TPA: hypothetical protein VHC22_32540 [Pirellulales bacterium]|nr:hypothetical protein [Pirellulales bacterium]
MKRQLLAAGVLFVGICVFNWHAIDDPPFWDAAIGMHPAAIWISEKGLSDLLNQPPCQRGGPNTHSLSLGTFVAAGCYRLFEHPLRIMHIGTFALAAAAAFGVYQLAFPLGTWPAIATAAAFATFPAMMAQMQALYLEIPMTACAIWSLIAWRADRRKLAILLATLAFWFCERGIVAPGALVIAGFIDEKGFWRRVRWSVAAAPALVIFAVQRYKSPHVDFTRPHLNILLGNLGGRFSAAWDVYMVTALGFAAAYLIWTTNKLPAIFLATFAAFFLVSGFIFPTYLLPRYFVLALPVATLAIVTLLNERLGQRAAFAGCAVLMAYAAVNHRGALFQANPTNEGSIAERSLEYRDLLAVHRDCAKGIETNWPSFYGYPEHFLVSYPKMGYVAQPAPWSALVAEHVTNLETLIRRHPERSPTLRFVYDWSQGAGAEYVRKLLALAKEHGWRVEEAKRFERGRYIAKIVEVSP